MSESARSQREAQSRFTLSICLKDKFRENGGSTAEAVMTISPRPHRDRQKRRVPLTLCSEKLMCLMWICDWISVRIWQISPSDVH